MIQLFKTSLFHNTGIIFLLLTTVCTFAMIHNVSSTFFTILLHFQKCDNNIHAMVYHNIESFTDIAAGLIGLLSSAGLNQIPHYCVDEKTNSWFASGLTLTLTKESLPFGVFACNQVAICLLARHRHEQIAKHAKYNHGQKPMRRMAKYCAIVVAVHILLAVLVCGLILIHYTPLYHAGYIALMSYQVRNLQFLYGSRKYL